MQIGRHRIAGIEGSFTRRLVMLMRTTTHKSNNDLESWDRSRIIFLSCLMDAAGSNKIDAKAGRLVWAKVGDWPWWPARIVSLDQVPEKVLGALGNSEKGVVVRFFEDPPK